MNQKKDAELRIAIDEAIVRFYGEVYAAKGERAAVLVEKAVLEGGKRYDDLVRKERFFDIVAGKLDGCRQKQIATCIPHGLGDRILARLRGWRMRRKISVGIAITLLLGAMMTSVSALLFPKPYHATSAQAVCMDGASALAGDFGNMEIVNYQHVSDLFPISDAMPFTERTVSFITASDGTPYLMVSPIQEEATALAFTLYRGDTDGWHAVGEGQKSASPILSEVTGETAWMPSEQYLFSDAESDVYAVTRLGHEIVIYRFHKRTECFDVVGRIPFHGQDGEDQLAVAFDPTCGDAGVAYIVCRDETEDHGTEDRGGWMRVFRYDAKTDEVLLWAEDLRLISAHSQFRVAAGGGTVYITDVRMGEESLGQGSWMHLNVIDQYGEVMFDYFEREEASPIVCMEIDAKEKLHIVTQNEAGICVHYLFSDVDAFTKAELGVSYRPYENTGYRRSMIGGFVGEDGAVYCTETYRDGAMGEKNFLAVGRLDSEDPTVYAYRSGFDLTDNVGHLFFQQGKDFWHIVKKYSRSKETLVYFHINELTKGAENETETK